MAGIQQAQRVLGKLDRHHDRDQIHERQRRDRHTDQRSGDQVVERLPPQRLRPHRLPELSAVQPRGVDLVDLHAPEGAEAAALPARQERRQREHRGEHDQHRGREADDAGVGGLQQQEGRLAPDQQHHHRPGPQRQPADQEQGVPAGLTPALPQVLSRRRHALTVWARLEPGPSGLPHPGGGAGPTPEPPGRTTDLGAARGQHGRSPKHDLPAVFRKDSHVPRGHLLRLGRRRP